MRYFTNIDEKLLSERIVDYSTRFKDDIIRLFKVDNYAGINRINQLNNSRQARKEYDNYISIKEIFIRYWDKFKILYKDKPIRKSIHNNIEKMIKCGSFDNGYKYYECLNDGYFHLVPFTCKSRFCPSCSKRYNDLRLNEAYSKLIDVKHRHMVFSISYKLRPLFRKYRFLIDELFLSVDDTFKYIARSEAKTIDYRFGFISTLHTFGRDLKFNPHLHVLCAELLLSDDNHKREYKHFNYSTLRKAFMFFMLNRIRKSLKNKEKNINALINEIIHEYDNGFYVYAPPMSTNNRKTTKEVIKYVLRYSAHPAISESRITNIDYKNDLISYYYDPHEDDHIVNEDEKLGRQYISESVYDFIAKIIVHIPDDNKHNTRYYGFYANKDKTLKKSKYNIIKINRNLKGYTYQNGIMYKTSSMLNHRDKILKSFGYDILICPKCGSKMILIKDMCYIPKERRKESYG